jgi:uncharacterized protein YlaN (UPF0358 family)
MDFMKDMWSDFNDYQLAKLCYAYGMEQELVFADNLTLANRTYIEKLLTDFEMELAASEVN